MGAGPFPPFDNESIPLDKLKEVVWSVIGAGSVVTKDIPDGVLAYGNPCRVIRPITEADRVEYSV